MNKKVLTLCAGLLLAGGTFGTINAAISATAQAAAAELTISEKYVVDYGKYFVLERANLYTGSWTSTGSDKYYLTEDAQGNLVYSIDPDLKDKSAYWTIEDVTSNNDPRIDGTTCVAKVKLVNAEKRTLAFDKGNADANGNLKVATSATTAANLVDEFYVLAGGSSCEGQLCIYDGTDEYRLGNVSTPMVAGGTEYEAVAVKYTSGGSPAVSGASINDVNAVGINEVAITADELNAELNQGFELSFTSKGKAYKNLTGAEAFSGKLTAIAANAAGTQYYLKTADDRYVILEDDYIGEADATLNGTSSAFYRGYNFTTVSEHAWSSANKNNGTFTIFKSYDFNNTDSLIVSLPVVNNIGSIPAAGLKPRAKNNESGLRVFVSTVNVAGTTSNLLTTIEYTKANDMLADVQDNAYRTAQMGALAPNIALGESNIIDYKQFIGKVWNITDARGNVMSPEEYTADIDEWSQLFAPAEQVDLSNPEGQWLFNQDEDGYYFVNRESGERFYLNNTWQGRGAVLRSTGTKNLYEVYSTRFSIDENETIYIREAKNAELGKTENGYVKFNMDEEDNNGKYLSFETSLGLTAYVGKDADDNVILTTDKSEAIEFRVKQLSHDFTDHDGIEAPDTLQHYTTFLNYNEDGDIISDVDTLQFFHYALYENFSEKYLKYDGTNKRFELSDEYDWDVAGNGHENFDLEQAYYAFVVKEKEDGSYILVHDYAIDYDQCDVTGTHHNILDDWNGEEYTYDNIFEVNFGADAYIPAEGREYYAGGNAHKAYMGTQNGGFLADMANLYNYNDNDRITMENTDQTEYMYITGSQDTVKIALQARPNYYLYEQGNKGTNFLGMEHVSDVDDMRAAIFVDTAYVRNNTYRPQYLLAVDAYHVDEVWDNHPSRPQDIPHLITPDTTYGRFLVNVVDSAYAYGINRNTNPYIWDTNYYYRLAFIDGYHTGDALYLNTENAQTKIGLSNNDDKLCTFAFRYVDADRDAVIIETRYNTTTGNAAPVRGYLKFQNSVPVVTSAYEDAHIFTVDNTTTEAPTANEEISAENAAVSVVATDGAVIIKGAEGKNVVIATILGKVVANETINSDNETIAVPAGIAVVSVDGESFKVVVK